MYEKIIVAYEQKIYNSYLEIDILNVITLK